MKDRYGNRYCKSHANVTVAVTVTSLNRIRLRHCDSQRIDTVKVLLVQKFKIKILKFFLIFFDCLVFLILKKGQTLSLSAINFP